MHTLVEKSIEQKKILLKKELYILNDQPIIPIDITMDEFKFQLLSLLRKDDDTYVPLKDIASVKFIKGKTTEEPKVFVIRTVNQYWKISVLINDSLWEEYTNIDVLKAALFCCLMMKVSPIHIEYRSTNMGVKFIDIVFDSYTNHYPIIIGKMVRMFSETVVPNDLMMKHGKL